MRSFRSESGYALPSVLLLVTLLTLVAFSVLSLQYLRRQQALLEIARVRSEYAAQSGVARTLAALKSQTLVNEAMAGAAERYEFDDGSSSTVLVDSWGLYLLVKSEGAFRAVKSTRVALAGAKPLACFDNALLLGNTEHQLVVTGTASITGDVVVGQRGVSTGTLPGTPTPSRLPITGKVTRRSVSPMPYLNKPDLARLAADMADLLRGNTSGLRARVQINAVTIPARGVIGTGDIPDSLDV